MDPVAEEAFNAALQAYLDKHDKMLYEPHIHQKAVSVYLLWVLVMRSGGYERVSIVDELFISKLLRANAGMLKRGTSTGLITNHLE